MAAESLEPDTLRGLRVFHDASDPRMSRDGYLSCASCHLEGDDDGAVWDFSDRGEGLRNTITLRGRRGTGHGNVHWTANFDEIQDFENDIRNAFGGAGFLSDADFAQTTAPLGPAKAGRSADLDALAKYVSSFNDFGRSAYRAMAGGLTDDARRGRRVFAQQGCNGCHAGPDFTDGRRHDVGTVGPDSGQASGAPFGADGIDTPTLLGVWGPPPYFHDGSAASLEAVLASGHGGAADLAADAREALVAYLNALERAAVEYFQVRLQAANECWQVEAGWPALAHPPCDVGEPGQMWRFDGAGGIRPMIDDGLCLMGQSANGPVYVGVCGSGPNQRWRFEDGVFQWGADERRVIDTRDGGSSADVTSLQPYNARKSQLWHLRSRPQAPRESTDAALAGLSVTGVVEDLAFAPQTLAYEVEPLDGVSEVTVEAAAADAGARVEIMDGDGSVSADASRPLRKTVRIDGTAAEVQVEVVAEDRQVVRLYTVVVRGAPQADASLSSLVLSGIDMGAFASETTSYVASVEHGKSVTTVTALATVSRATVEIASVDADPDTAGHQVSLDVGANEIEVTVTASDGVATRTYVVTVTRAGSSDASLSALSLSGLDVGAFVSGTTEYAVAAPPHASVTTVRAVASDADAAVAIAPADADGETSGHQIPLVVGATVIEVTVTAADGATTRTYRVTVTRAPPPEVSISAASASVVEGTPAAFTATLSEALSGRLTVPVAVTFEGAFASGEAPAAVVFAAGETIATLSVATDDDAVVEGDGSVTVTVTLEAGAGYALGTPASAPVAIEDDDAAVWSVSVEPSELEEGGRATVTVSIANGVTHAADVLVSLAVTGEVTAADYALAPAELALAAGGGTASATLTALDDGEVEPAETATVTARIGGEAVGSATLTVLATDLSDDASLASLTLSGVDPGTFDAETTAYAGGVAHDVGTTTVTATASDAGATVAVAPADADSAAGHQVALGAGATVIEVTVTAADGATTRTYRVTVTRAPPPEVSISAASASVAEGTPATFTATLSEALAGPLAVPVAVVFAAGETIATLSVATDDDAVVEGDGSVTVTLEAGAGYALGRPASAPVAIEDDDAAVWSVAVEPSELEESGRATVTVSIANAVTHAEAQTIALAVSGEVSATDYALEPAELALAAGAGSATATLTAVDDGETELAETATVTARVGGEAVGAASLTIGDAKETTVAGVPQVGATLRAGPVAGAQGYQWLRGGAPVAGSTGAAHVLTSADAGAAMSVRVLRGGAWRESAATIPVWGPPGNPPPAADEEEVFATLLTVGSSRGDYPLHLAGYGRLSLAEFGAASATTFESGGAERELTLAMVNSVGEFGLATAPALADAEGLAAYWDGYRMGALEARSSREGPLWTARTPQARAEYARYLDGSSDGVRVALSLRRELSAPAVSVSALSATVAEGEPALFEVALERARSEPLAVAVEVSAAGDVLAAGAPTSATVAAGETTARVVVETHDDRVVEGDGSVTLTVVEGEDYVVGDPSSATVTVLDDDAAEFAVTVLPAEIAEGGTAQVRMTVLDGVTFAADRTLALEVSGGVTASDYALEPSVLDLAAGESSATARFEALSDGVAEDRETALVTVSLDGVEATSEVTIRDASTDARLSLLELTDADIGPFDADTTAYAAEVPAEVASTTVTAEPADTNAAVEIADAAGSTLGAERTSALAEGANAIAATVTAEDGRAERTYAVTVTRAAAPAWGERLAARDIALSEDGESTGVWSDGETLWALDWNGETARAYALATGERLRGRDLEVENYAHSALWSDGETLWVSGYYGGAMAYRLADGARLPDEDLDEMLAAAGNDSSTGLWSDRRMRRVLGRADARVYLFGTDGTRFEEREFGLRGGDVRSGWMWGLWSDGETLLTSHSDRGRVLAYRLSDGARLPAMDIDTGAAGNAYPRDLWSDGETLWVADAAERRLYAYKVPGLGPESEVGLLPVTVTSRAVRVPAADPGLPVAIADGALRARVAAALGKGADEPIGAAELAALTALNARHAGIVDLSGLEHAVNLTALDLGGNAVRDVRVLAELPRLETLNADATGLDPWELAGLAGLRSLSLRDNGLDDLGALASLARLRVLDIGGNRVSDLGPLSGLRRLTALRADGNAIGDVAPLASLDALKTLDLRGNPVKTEAGGPR